MSSETVERCDCCGTKVPVLGSRSLSGNHDVHRRRVRRFTWQFFPRRLSWGVSSIEWESVCGDCWQAIGDAVKSRRDAVGEATQSDG